MLNLTYSNNIGKIITYQIRDRNKYPSSFLDVNLTFKNHSSPLSNTIMSLKPSKQ